jgi:hypothetical protein
MMPIKTTNEGAAKALTVKIKDGELRISIGIGLRAHAVQMQGSWPEEFEITDIRDFAKSMRYQLIREEEDGTMPVHRMFDKAALGVLEQGDPGVDEGSAENGLKTAKAFIKQLELQARPEGAPAPAEHHWFSKAFIDVGAERRRQIEVEGYSYDHDDQYRQGELERAGAAYALYSCRPGFWFVNDIWAFSRRFWKPRSHRENLVRAAAFLIAAIETIDRREQSGG